MKLAVNPLIMDQSFEFVIMLFAGMTLMLFYEIFSLIKNKTKPRPSISFIQDILFWFFASILTSSFLYYCSFGRLSVHAMVAFGLGAILWKSVFYDIISPYKSSR